MKHFQIEDGKEYFAVNEGLVTIENKNNDENYFNGYAQVLYAHMVWEEEWGEHIEEDSYSEGYGFNGKVYDTKEDLEEDGYELTSDEVANEERNICNFETSEEAEKFISETLKKKAEEYSFY